METPKLTHGQTEQFFREFFDNQTRKQILSDIDQLLTTGRLMLGPGGQRRAFSQTRPVRGRRVETLIS